MVEYELELKRVQGNISHFFDYIRDTHTQGKAIVHGLRFVYFDTYLW